MSFKVSQLRRQRGAKFDSSGLIFPWADREWSLPGSAQGLNKDGAWSHRCCWPSSAIKSSRKTIAAALNHWPFYKIQEAPVMKRNRDSTEPHSFLIEVELIYNAVLVSGIQHNDSIIYIQLNYIYIYYFYRFFSVVCLVVQSCLLLCSPMDC